VRGEAMAHYHRMHPPNCFADAINHLMGTEAKCMVRESFGANATSSSVSVGMVPIYIMHAPFLVRRRAFMHGQLERLAARDVTWVTCANRQDVDQLSPTLRACAYPCVQMNRFGQVNASTGEAIVLSNGTVSLALKHKLAAVDMYRRGLQMSLLLEDDATLPFNLWGRIAGLQMPGDMQIFWLGSYSRRSNVGTLRGHTPVSNGIYLRNASLFPVILGAVAYMLTSSGARIVAAEPVTTAADVAISLFPGTGFGSAFYSARRTSASLDKQIAVGRMRTFADGTCEDEGGHRFTQRTPSRQYGPNEWIIWPVSRDEQMRYFGDHGGTHGSSRRLASA
jgi:hypothetical protein